MKNTRKRNLRTKGVTLIVLVVTIIILLMLAGITINLILEPNSILKMAKEVGEKTNIVTEDEKIKIENIEQWIKNKEDQSNTNSEKNEEKQNNTQENQTNTEISNPSVSTGENVTSQQLGYITSNLLLHYDGIANNKTTAHSATATTWKDLSGNNKNGTLTRLYMGE